MRVCLLWIVSWGGNSSAGESTEKEQGKRIICRKNGTLEDMEMDSPDQPEGREWLQMLFP